MKFTLYKMNVALKENFFSVLRWILSPLKYFFTKEKEKARYEKRIAKITEEKAVRWIAEDIIKYILRKKSEIDILICDYANEDYFWSDCTLKSTPYYIKRQKTRDAYYKCPMNIDLQVKIIEKIKSLKVVKVQEEIEEMTNGRIDNYQKTVKIYS